MSHLKSQYNNVFADYFSVKLLSYMRMFNHSNN